MSAPQSMPDPAADRRGVMFWLPPGGFGNNIPADAWAEIADLHEIDLATVLMSLAQAQIGAYVAEQHGPLVRVHHGDRKKVYRLWVDPQRYHAAEDILMAVFRPTR